MRYSDHEVYAAVLEIHRGMNYKKPPFSTSEAIFGLFPEVEVVGRAMERHAEIEVYPKPLHNGKQAVISYSETDHATTQRFSVAHELAHWILDCGRGEHIPTEWNCSTDPKHGHERRADFFAAEFLVPLWLLDEYVTFEIYPNRDDMDAVSQRDQAIQRIASRFNVSLRCAKRRVFDLHAWRRITR